MDWDYYYQIARDFAVVICAGVGAYYGVKLRLVLTEQKAQAALESAKTAHRRIDAILLREKPSGRC